jgi:hypothetical protein
MDSDNFKIPELHKLLQEIFRLTQENQVLAHDLRDAELRHMQVELAFKMEKELNAKLKQIAFSHSVQEGVL